MGQYPLEVFQMLDLYAGIAIFLSARKWWRHLPVANAGIEVRACRNATRRLTVQIEPYYFAATHSWRHSFYTLVVRWIYPLLWLSVRNAETCKLQTIAFTEWRKLTFIPPSLGVWGCTPATAEYSPISLAALQSTLIKFSKFRIFPSFMDSVGDYRW